MSRRRPPLLLRLAVMAGGFTLLLGLVGLVLVVLRGDDPASAAGPGLGERVRVVGAPQDVALTVHVRWQEGAIHHSEAARPLGSEGHVFLLPPGLSGLDVVIDVRDADVETPLARRDVRLARGAEVTIEVEGADER